MTHSENYIHKRSLPPTGRHIPGPREQGNTVAVSKNTASAYLTILASLCFLIQCFRFATTEWEITEQVRVEAGINVGRPNSISYEVQESSAVTP